MTWHSRVATKLARQGLGARRQSSGRAYDKALYARPGLLRQALSAHDRDARAIEEFCRDRLGQ